MPKKKRAKIGAECEVQLKYMHLSKLINEHFPQFANQQKLEKILALCQETKFCVVFCHEYFDGKKLHCFKRWAHVTQEGLSEQYFEVPEPQSTSVSKSEAGGVLQGAKLNARWCQAFH